MTQIDISPEHSAIISASAHEAHETRVLDGNVVHVIGTTRFQIDNHLPLLGRIAEARDPRAALDELFLSCPGEYLVAIDSRHSISIFPGYTYPICFITRPGAGS